MKIKIETPSSTDPNAKIEVDLASDDDVAAAIRTLARTMGIDEGHSYSDFLVAETLRYLGYRKAAEAFDEIPKLFS